MYRGAENFRQLNDLLIQLRERRDVARGYPLWLKENWGDCQQDFNKLDRLIRNFVKTVYFQTNPEDIMAAQTIKSKKIIRRILRYVFETCAMTERIISSEILGNEIMLIENIANPTSQADIYVTLSTSDLIVSFKRSIQDQ